MGTLYLVPTPIGNLEDITLRAIRLLKETDLILAEDTRNSSKLLKHFGITTPMQSYHAHNEHQKASHFINRLKNGENIAVITDAGTPGISDPGFLLVRESLSEGIKVECLPGATALIPALVSSGLPCDKFVFEGFLPEKKGRQTRLEYLKNEQRSMVFYVSPHKVVKDLKDMADAFGNERMASLSRELTKIHEQTLRNTLGELLMHCSRETIKGEIVLIVAGNKEKA